MKKIIIYLSLLIINIQTAFSNEMNVIEASPMAHNPKIKAWVYSPDAIYKYVGTYQFQSHIKFQTGETIKTISMGNTSGWEIIKSGSRMFLRPINASAKTNMTLITNKRLYRFLLDAKSVKSFTEPEAIFEARFLYSDDANNFIVINDNKAEIVDLSDPSKYNFNYSFSGPDNIAPLKIFDDGKFTYFELKEKSSQLAAVFYVDSAGYEGLVNYRVKGNYLIVERINDKFTLRHGSDTICVFNNNLIKQKPKK
jgi:type IV secretion system protein VirB9